MYKCDSLPSQGQDARGALLHVRSVDISKASSVPGAIYVRGKLNTIPVPGEPAVCRGGEAFLKRPHGIHDKPVTMWKDGGGFQVEF